MSSAVQAVILAAGFSRRMGQPKAMLPIEGQTFLTRLISLYHKLQVKVWVVVSDPRLRTLGPTTKSLNFLENPNPQDGPLSSIRIALGRIGDSSGFLTHPVDHPLVSIATLETLLVEHSRDSSTLLIPTCDGRKGHPVLFPARLFEDLRQGPLDQGARRVVRENSSAVRLVEVHDPGILANLNTPEDLEHWGLRLP